MLNILKSIKLSGIQIASCLKNRKLRIRQILPLHQRINNSGDYVKNMDIVANKIFLENLSTENSIYELISEEEDKGIVINYLGNYIVSFDPLDGSNNINSNDPLGSLFCIFEKNTKVISGRNIVAAGYIYYGVNTELVLAMNNNVQHYTYSDTLKCFVNNYLDDEISNSSTLKIPVEGQYYCHNDGNNHELPENKIKEFLGLLMWTKKLRYSGCLVSDFHRILLNGGCFLYPANKNNKNGKIRLVYEAYPIAYITEMAGGYSRFDESQNSILDISFPYEDIHKKIPVLFMGESENNIFDKL